MRPLLKLAFSPAYIPSMSTTMIPLDVAQWRDLFLLTAVAVEQQYTPVHRDVLADHPDSEDVTDDVESSHNSRKRVLSVDWNAGHSLKRAKDNAGDVVVTCSASEIRLKFGKENDEMTEDLGSTSALVHRRINPLPKRAEGNQRFITSLSDVDISWIPKSYRNNSRKTPDTRLHKLFLSECNYSLTEYHENGTIKRRSKEEREAFLRADEWVEYLTPVKWLQYWLVDFFE
ncbi:uncharacterized protein EV420DRAFT_1486089 [Desarmillaria tabescens]|uniref:Uncharacterized protein n=1 Tax=Armillaria tabescens TaxID=1929756 RepID=A0AA39JCV0_ARMTA|nr:uncharacterized protein EV420DRAFT_1486089 [Desarmillaria tabescens]KAK0439994.1 hypothetical protein EV420DRAFT_1486089 [Desarmillaria tabescens]